MRERFEKLPSVAKYLKFVFWNSETKGYCNNSGNPVPLDFAAFINGAWYAYQEQQKKLQHIYDDCTEYTTTSELLDSIREILK